MFGLTRNIILILSSIILLLAALVLYISLGVTVITTYNNESQYKKTKCIVRAIESQQLNSKVDWFKCPWSCTLNHTPDGLKTFCQMSEFPCKQIVVDVHTKHGLKSAILHENPEKMQKYPECSTYHCDQDSVVNEREVDRFRRRYGQIGKEMSCFYNLDSLDSDDYDDDGQEHALLKLSYNTASYVNSIFWPTFVAVCAIVLGTYGLFSLYKEKQLKKNSKQEQIRRLLNSDI